MSADNDAHLILDDGGDIQDEDMGAYGATAGMRMDAALPSRMDPRRYASLFSTCDDGLELTYHGIGSDAVIVPADRAIPNECGVFYFEATLHTAPDTRCAAPLSIGVATLPIADNVRTAYELERSPLAHNELRYLDGRLHIVPAVSAATRRRSGASGHVGSSPGSVGYTPHTNTLAANGTARRLASSMCPESEMNAHATVTVGCIADRRRGRVAFTRDGSVLHGEEQHPAWAAGRDTGRAAYPVVGVCGRHTRVAVRFCEGFAFDWHGWAMRARHEILAGVLASVPRPSPLAMLRLVHAHLVSAGYSRTADALSASCPVLLPPGRRASVPLAPIAPDTDAKAGAESHATGLDPRDPARTPIAYAAALAARSSAFAAFGVLQLRAPHILDANERLDYALRSALTDEVAGARLPGWAAALRMAAGFCAEPVRSRAVHAWLLDRAYFCERRALPVHVWGDEDATMVISHGHVRVRDVAAMIAAHGDCARYAPTPLEAVLQHVLCLLSAMRAAGMDTPMFAGRILNVCLSITVGP